MGRDTGWSDWAFKYPTWAPSPMETTPRLPMAFHRLDSGMVWVVPLGRHRAKGSPSVAGWARKKHRETLQGRDAG